MDKKYNLVELEQVESDANTVKDEPHDILSSSCFILLCGKPGDGKSTLISTMLK